MDERGEVLGMLRESALARVDAIHATLKALLDERAGLNDDDEHDPEGVPMSSEWSRLAGMMDDAKAELSQIDQALVRADEGTYGLCTGCSLPIPAARLEVRPFATQCVACASR